MEWDLQRVNHQGHGGVVQANGSMPKSGQRVSEWCGEHGIPISTYYSWQRKVYLAAVSENEVCFTEVPVRLAAVEIAASVQCGELRVDIYMGADPETIQAIIRALKSC